MRESLMIRPFVELENSFLRAWHPSGGWLPPCFHKYYRAIPVDEGNSGKNDPPPRSKRGESRIAIRVVVSLVEILLRIGG